MYLAFQAVHSPDEVPQSYIDPYNATIADVQRRTFAGMLSCLDEAVGNVTAALSASGFDENTLIVFVAVRLLCRLCRAPRDRAPRDIIRALRRAT